MVRDLFKRFVYLHMVEWILDKIARRHGKKSSDTSTKDALSMSGEEKLDLLECMSNFARRSTLEADEKLLKGLTVQLSNRLLIRTIKKKNEKLNTSKVVLKK
jgi:hypothetical protein